MLLTSAGIQQSILLYFPWNYQRIRNTWFFLLLRYKRSHQEKKESMSMEASTVETEKDCHNITKPCRGSL